MKIKLKIFFNTAQQLTKMMNSSSQYSYFNSILKDFNTFEKLLYEGNERGELQPLIFDILNEGSKAHVNKLTGYVSQLIRKDLYKFSCYLEEDWSNNFFYLDKYFLNTQGNVANKLLCDRFPSWAEKIIQKNKNNINCYRLLRSFLHISVICCSVSMNYDECFRLAHYFSTLETGICENEESCRSLIVDSLFSRHAHNVVDFTTYVFNLHGVNDFSCCNEDIKMNVCELVETCCDNYTMKREDFLQIFEIKDFTKQYKQRFEKHHQEIILRAIYIGNFEFLDFLFKNHIATAKHFNFAFEFENDGDCDILRHQYKEYFLALCLYRGAPPLKVTVFE